MKRRRELAEALLGDERGRREVTKALLEITSRTAANAEGDVGVGLSILVNGDVHSIGATSAAAEKLDHGQATDGDGPCLRALGTGEAVGVHDYASDERWPTTSRRAAEVGVRSSLSLPLTTGRHVLGALNVYSDTRAAFGRNATSSLWAFAQQATTSLFLLGELQTQRAAGAYVTAFSDTIQASLRTVLPHVVGLELAGASVPWSKHAAVGGDWYDAFVLPDHSLGLVIGDVMGHGIDAITVMSQVRTMVRTAAWAGLDPAAVLNLIDRLAYESDLSETITVFYANLRTGAGGPELQYSNAGHPLPLLRAADGSVAQLEDGGRPLIGAIGAGSTSAEDSIGTVGFPADSVLFLYTDGLVERPGADDEVAVAALRRTLEELDHAVTLDHLLSQVLEQPSTTDDTTAFAVRAADRPTG